MLQAGCILLVELGFNTENGMWRAAMFDHDVADKAQIRFQYRERYVEGCNDYREKYGELAAKEFQYRERYVEGCNVEIIAILVIVAAMFQYRERYVEGCNMANETTFDLQEKMFQYRERYVEGCNVSSGEVGSHYRQVSIPRTVCGGLQSVMRKRSRHFLLRFNTENGMWRAAISRRPTHMASASSSFNTENGMWRAAII